MARRISLVFAAVIVLMFMLSQRVRGGDSHGGLKPEFQTSDRCLACHNQLTTPSGRDVSIGLSWRASVMANSSRDPYWQASVRRETIDHSQLSEDIQDECSVCHMPVARYEAKVKGQRGKIFNFLPFDAGPKKSAAAADGVTCSICHQISNEKLGTRDSFNGGFVIHTPTNKDDRHEYGPFDITPGNQRIMQTSTGGYQPTAAKHIRDSALCGTCHQLYTTAYGSDGKPVGYLAEQMPYLEWQHSDYPAKYSCQGCHMPEVSEPVAISSVLGTPRVGMHRHTFVGANSLLQNMLNRYRDDLSVAALPNELTAAAEETTAFLQSEAARLEIQNLNIADGRLQADVVVTNLSGHKLPTAYPSRRAWLHFSVHDRDGKLVFDSGALNLDGSIAGNDNDADPARYEPHYREISSSDQVQIYEPILRDSGGQVTTGLLSAVGYIKDNRLLPTGFDKQTADKDIAVAGDAADDPDFAAGSDRVRYNIPLGGESGPFHIEAELCYQPIGFRWAHNLATYRATETERFVRYYDSMGATTETVLARTQATR